MFVLGRGLIAFALLALWIYCIFDVIRTEESSVQNLPKMFWLMIVIFLPDIGSIAWLLLGRPAKGTWDLRGPQRSKPAPAGPQTGLPESRPPMPDYEARREEALQRYMSEREEELKKREEEIRRLEEEFRKKNDDETPNN